MNGDNQLNRSITSGTINNEQNRVSSDIVRDLPPKSPGNRRTVPTLPPKVKRGEVKSCFNFD